MQRGATVIRNVRGIRVWDSRGQPGLEVEVTLDGGAVAIAGAPAAGWTAPGEAADLRDGGAAFGGRDVTRAIAGIDRDIAAALGGLDAMDQEGIDRRLIALDGTPDRRRLGGAAMLATSLAVAQAAAAAEGVALWRHLARGATPASLPLPRVAIVDCGTTPGTAEDIAGLSLVPVAAEDYASALDWSAVATHALAALVEERGRGRATATPRGALGISRAGSDELIEMTVRAIERSGFAAGEELALAIDVRAGRYGRRGRYRIGDDGRETDTAGMIERYLGWLRRYPVVSLVDPLGVDEIGGVAALAAAAGSAVEVASGDGALGDPRRIRLLADEKAGDALLLKPGQVATLTELGAAVSEARAVGWRTIVAARSGETSPGWLAHLAVAWGISQLAAGGLARGERTAVWNEGLRLARHLPGGGLLPSRSDFPW
jgi:enolase